MKPNTAVTYCIGGDCILAALNEHKRWTASLNWPNGRQELSREYDTQDEIIAAAERAYERLQLTYQDVDIALHAILDGAPPNPAYSSRRFIRPWN